MISITGAVNLTITELEKRIAELEINWHREQGQWLAARQERDTERKRREECEAVLREVARAPNRIAENSRIIADYFGEGN